MAGRIVPYYTYVIEYTQTEEDDLALTLVGQEQFSKLIFNTTIGRNRIWDGTAFQNAPLCNPDGGTWSGGGSVDWVDVQNKPSTFPPTLGADDNFATDAEKVKLSNLSNTNSGDQDLSGKSDVGHNHDSAYEAKNTNIQSHIANTSNPHSTTKAHVGLANVDNTSDATKPVSSATQTALDLKQTISTNTGGWTVHKVAGSNATTTGQALVDITGLVTGTLANSTKYEIEVILHVSTSAVTTGCRYAVFGGGSGGAATINAMVNGTTTAAAAGVETINTIATQTATAYLTTSGSSGTIIIRGFVTTRGSGTADIRIQFLKVTSGTATAFIGSVFRYRLA